MIYVCLSPSGGGLSEGRGGNDGTYLCSIWIVSAFVPEIHLPLRPASWRPHAAPPRLLPRTSPPAGAPPPTRRSCENLWPLLIGRAENCRVLCGKKKEEN